MADTPAQAPATQTPQQGGATKPQAPAASSNPPKSRFNRDKLLSEIGNPLDEVLVPNQRSFKYPLDVGVNPEFPHYVVFYPLVREDSPYGKRLGSSGVIFDQSDQNRVDPQNNLTAAGAAGALAGAAIGIGKALSSAGGRGSSGADGAEQMSAVTSVATKIGSIFSGGAIGGAAGGLFGLAAAGLAGEQRLVFGDNEIILHVSEKVSAAYTANWDQGDLGGIVGALASGQMNFSAGELSDYAMRKASKIAGLTGFDALTNVIESTSKKVENPYKEQLFRSMGFRKFLFDYRFSPRNRDEAIEIFGEPNSSVEGIIPTFLRHMHPTKSKSGLFLSYPSEFLIIYYHNGEENKFVRKISNCALTNMAIDYGAEGYTTFADGMPTEATIRLEFTELETLTADRIEKGF
jgi:hypothetical protein